MKRSIYLIAILAIFVLYNSYGIKPEQILLPSSKSLSDFTKQTVPNIPLTLDEKYPQPQTQAITYYIFDQYESSIWSHLEKVTPFAYDPKTGYMYVVGMDREFTGGNLTHAPVHVKRTTNSGSTWDSLPLFTEPDFGGFYPSIAVSNINSVNTLNDIPFVVFSQLLVKSGTQWSFGGGLVVYNDGANITPDVFDGPKVNNPSNGQYWGKMKMRTFMEGSEAYNVSCGMLDPKNSGFQYGYYGAFAWDVAGKSEITSNVPPQWTVDKFQDPQITTSTYNSPMEFDFDENGKLYAIVENNFRTDEDHRVPAFSASEDMGQSWTDFSLMPFSTIENYVTGLGYTGYHNIGPYDQMAFIVTGVNKFSYFYRLGMFNTGDTQFRDIHIVECTYDNGNWGIRKVADINGFPKIFVYSSTFSTANAWVFRLEDDPLGHELQVVKTADGQNILLKWIDVTLYLPIIPPQTISYMNANNEEVQGTIDSMYTTDVFISYRGINSSNWTSANNVTNDSLYNKVTWLPNVIPSISNVPMIGHFTPVVTNTQHPLYGVPRVLVQAIADVWPYVCYCTFNATTTSVNEKNQSTSDLLYDVVPNPVSGYTEISFNLANDCNARIELSNSLGQRIVTLLDGFQTAGNHAINVNVDNYPSGVYYCTLTTDKGAFTKILNVVK